MRLGPAVMLLACFLSGACDQETVPIPSDPADPNGEITTAMDAEPDTIDPQRESFPNEIAQTLMVYEPLLTFDAATLRPVPAAARSLPEVSDDGLTVTFTLRDGLTYSDGRDVPRRDASCSSRSVTARRPPRRTAARALGARGTSVTGWPPRSSARSRRARRSSGRRRRA